MSQSTQDVILEIKGLRKTFPPNIVALDKADMTIRKGEVHCLLGANGAGKSTFLKLVAGAISPTAGEIAIDGRITQFPNTSAAADAGISMIYQELDLVPQMTVAENIFLGHTPSKLGFVDKATRTRLAKAALERVGARFSPGARVEELSIADQQLSVIARSLTRDARVIIMDEPSATLNEAELEKVFEVVRELKAQGVAIVYVSHRLGELREIGDRVTVLRNGSTIDTYDIDDCTDDMLIEAVLGGNRQLVERHERPPLSDEVVLEVSRLTGPGKLVVKDFTLRRGEISGLTGLNGSGRTAFLNALFGAVPHEADMSLHGKPYKAHTPRQAIDQGFGLVPKGRKTEGLILEAPIHKNATLPTMMGKILARHGQQRAKAVDVLSQLSTKYGTPDQAVIQLSGGNQQKVVLAKWVVKGSTLLLMDEPSRGLDIGAKADLYTLVEDLAAEGASIIIASSELDELYAICDSIWVFHEGRNIGRYDPALVDQDTILKRQILGSSSHD